MRTFHHLAGSFVIVLLIVLATRAAAAGPPPQALEAYVNAYAAIGKQAALMMNNRTNWTNAQSLWITAVANAEAKLIQARADWITAVAEVNATNAKTLVTLEQVRSARLDNDLKKAKVFYDKRALHDAYAAANGRKRPTAEDAARYSKWWTPQRPCSYELDPVSGRIHWPEILQEEQFCGHRDRLDCLFSQRDPNNAVPGSELACEVAQVVGQMRETLRDDVREMDPVEYMAVRRFIDGLTYEARFPAQIDGVAAK